MKDSWDVVIIGGGPAGMMAAGTAAARGLRVLLLEKNPKLGKKLRITGGGRCNITNATFDNQNLLPRYGDAKQYLFSPFSEYGVKETIEFFNHGGLETKVEAENRVFPASEKAEDVALFMEEFIQKHKVTVYSDTTVTDIKANGNKIEYLKTNQGDIYAKSFILATGGTSHPETGSTGDGYNWLIALGLEVIIPTPSLVPITTKETWVSDISGLSFSDTKINVYLDGVLLKKSVGKILFTHTGLSGPGILNLSHLIGDSLPNGIVTIKINVSNTQDEEGLSNQLRDSLITHANKKIKNILSDLTPASLVPIILQQLKMDGERQCNSITRNERHLIVSTLRGLELTASGLLGPDKAIIASGGLALEEIDFKTMSTKRYPNLYIVGDMLNINRPSGGYSLQLCWTTGYVAGKNAEAN